MQNKKIILHTCCAICSGYPISYLKDMGYDVVAYFYNPNIHPKEEYERRLDAEKKLCKHFDIELVEAEYNQTEYFEYVKGLKNEPEKGLRCDKCFELRLRKTAQFAESCGINLFTTSIVISPHKNFERISKIGEQIASEYRLNYVAIDFKKKDGFLKTNRISRELELYRQNYCGCLFSGRLKVET